MTRIVVAHTNHYRTSLALAVAIAIASTASAQEAEWIWTPKHSKDRVPQVSCHFRKSFTMRSPEEGQITITADDQYELYVNGRRVGRGRSTRQMQEYDVTRALVRGRNTLAIRVTNRRGSTAALAARVLVKDRGKEWANYSTDRTWKTQLNPFPLWNTSLYNDRLWPRAQSFGKLGDTPPWDIEEGVASEDRHLSGRFQVAEDFEVQRILDDEQTGSLIALTVNEFGHIIASRSDGPLLLIYDSNKDGVHDKVRVYCDKVKSCQGLLALNGDVYATGDGPDGAALYRLSDRDRDGRLEEVKTLLKFKGGVSEHGAHGITLGPDGLLYVMLGNHTRPERDYGPRSPHRNFYEGDLIRRYEDPGGHAVGVKAPGGVILRTDINGRSVQCVAGGLRNAYDLAFDENGELYTFDSDMESDLGSPWYRPTNIYQVLPGGEYGWRSGWAKWPDYFVDSLPAIGDAGRGSPTGVTVYNHVKFPARYHGALFLADWSEGRILAVRLKADGAARAADTEVFLQGQPLNVTDLEVGPDGALYFVTGGRGTSGGVYRISWKGRIPPELTNYGSGIAAAIRQPQLNSAWSRQRIAALKRDIGQQWAGLLENVARSTENPSHYRTRALDVMQLFGPAPSTKLLRELAAANSEQVRAKAAELMGLHPNPQTAKTLVTLLDDSDRLVRRKACEALARAGQAAPIKKLMPLLKSDDRFEAWAARRLLEQLDVDKWKDEVLAAEDHRTFVQGALALMIAEPSNEHAQAVIDRVIKLMGDFVSDRDFIDMLRLLQVTVHRSELDKDDVAELRHLLVEEFPAGDKTMNRELVRLLAHLQATSIMDRYLEYLESDAPHIEKVHLAMHMRFFESGWTSSQKVRLIEFFEAARAKKSGNSVPLYIMHVTRDFARTFNGEEMELVLANGHRWPNAALGALYRLPKKLDPQSVETLVEMDRKIAYKEDKAFRRLQVGVVAVLARDGGDQPMQYLREVWARYPERRQSVALGLAQNPDGQNWSYLVRSLALLDGPAARDVLKKLLDVEKAPADVEYHRQVILSGLRLKEAGAIDAVRLLEYWTGESFAQSSEDWKGGIEASQKWFHENHPERPKAELPVESQNAKWKYEELLEYLQGDGSKGSIERGRKVFVKADCIKCHRFGDRGESLGPDLTSVARRFMKKEILQSILYPSMNISDQYSSKSVLTRDGRKFSGIVAAAGNGEVQILQASGKKTLLRRGEIEEMAPHNVSAMPAGTLDKLTLQEISDLFAYLTAPASGSVASKPDE